ncbi:MAG: hypothetical protein A2Y94_01510 [Caldithrix sp. RBG_13_44_9]|nr:MAG: hypothetical protein A2Y94_01510 [Caldithrix sp. RBG_13_44_9]
MKIQVCHNLKYVFLLTFLFLLLSCGSRVPIALVDQAIVDDRLVGVWWAMDSTANESIELIIYKFNEQEYSLEMREEKQNSGKSEKDTLHLRAYIVEIKGKRFINVQMIESLEAEDRLFFFFNYSLEQNNRMQVRPLEDVGKVRIDDFPDSESLHAFIEQQVNNDSLYGETSLFVKQETKKP